MSFPEADILRREAAALSELAALQRDPFYRGVGVPRGDGRIVLVLPGLFGNDFYLQPLRTMAAPHRLLARPLDADDQRRLPRAAPQRRSRRACPSRSSADPDRSPSSATAGAACSRGPSPAGSRSEASHLVLLGSPAPAVVAIMRAGDRPNYRQRSPRQPVAAAGRRSLQLLDPDCTVPECGCPYTEDLAGRPQPRAPGCSPSTAATTRSSPPAPARSPGAARTSRSPAPTAASSTTEPSTPLWPASSPPTADPTPVFRIDRTVAHRASGGRLAARSREDSGERADPPKKGGHSWTFRRLPEALCNCRRR